MTRGGMVCRARKAFRKKRLADTASLFGLSMNSTVAPVESTARYKYIHSPLTGYPLGDIGLVHTPGIVGWLEPGLAFPFEDGSITLDPSVDGRMIGGEASLG